MDKYEKFIGEYFGTTFNVLHEIVSPDIHLDILVFSPTKERNYYTLITMGMSGYKMNVPKELENKDMDRAELIMFLPPDWNINSKDEKDYWPINQMKRIARLPIYAKTWLGLGHTTANDENNTPFSDNTQLSSIILLSIFNKKLDLNGIGKINFYTLVPLYEEELNYKFKNGFEKLMNLFVNNNMPLPPVIDINRKNFAKEDNVKNAD